MNTERTVKAENNEGDVLKKKSVAIYVLIFLLLLTLIFAGIVVIKYVLPSLQGTQTGGVGLTVDLDAGEYVEPEPVEQKSLPNVAIPGWGSIPIPADNTEVTVDFYNPQANAGYYYLTFELRLPDDSQQGYEVLYKSGLVEPNKHIQQITLSRGLAAGEYEAIVRVQPYTMDEDRKPTNNADMKTKLIVK